MSLNLHTPAHSAQPFGYQLVAFGVLGAGRWVSVLAEPCHLCPALTHHHFMTHCERHDSRACTAVRFMPGYHSATSVDCNDWCTDTDGTIQTDEPYSSHDYAAAPWCDSDSRTPRHTIAQHSCQVLANDWQLQQLLWGMR